MSRTILTVLLLTATSALHSQEPGPDQPGRGSNRITPTVRAVAKVLPSVVNISTERIVTTYSKPSRYDPFAEPFNRFRGLQQHYKTNSLGSGVIVAESGLVLTNEHVVNKASRIIVSLADGNHYDATPVAVSVATDLALLKLEGLPADKKLAAIRFAAPGDLLLGERVITVGNPFGLGHSVAEGVLSATGRKFIHQGQVIFEELLQTDAAVNPGNSGGPLVNADAELIGINLAIRKEAEGISFAIPMNTIEQVLGVWLIPSRFGLHSGGLVPGSQRLENGALAAFVKELLEGSPASRSGLELRDVIVGFNGVAVRQALDVSRLLWPLEAGDKVELELAGGKQVSFEIARIPAMSGEELARQKLQVELQEVTARIAAAMHLGYSRGLVVSEAAKGSVLARRGIQRGDVIIQVGELPVSNFTDLYRALIKAHHGDAVPIVIHRVLYQQGIVFLRRYVLTVEF